MRNAETAEAPLLAAPKGPLCVPPASDETVELSIIVPTFNERESIGELLRRVTTLLDPELRGRYEIILVDDDSPDGTWAAAQSLSVNYPSLRVMRRQSERGLATAVIRGWQVARGSVLCVIDADLQHPPEALLDLRRLIRRGADLAVASRHVEGGGVSNWSLVRRIVSRIAQLIGLVVLPGVVGRVSDPMSGYFMVRRQALEGIELDPLGYKILIEVLARARLTWIGEVPYVFQEREAGGSKATLKVYLDYLRHLARLRFTSSTFRRFIRFAVVGTSGVVVDMGLLYLLSDPHMLGWGLTRSKLIAAQTALINNFTWNDLWTFGDISARQPGTRARLHRFVKFQLICSFGLALNTVLLNVQFNLLHMNRYVANAIAIAVVTAWNFLLNLKLGWRSAEPAAQSR